MNILVALLVFGFIVFFHELGHFYFAKRAGVTIHEFSIGMGPTIYEKEKEGIKYSLRLLPIGGFVAMEGENNRRKAQDYTGRTDSQYCSLYTATPTCVCCHGYSI